VPQRHVLAAGVALALLGGCDGQETSRPKWISLPVTPGESASVQLVGVDSGLCLEIGGSGYSDRDPVQLAECAVSSRQQFRLVHKTGGQFQVISASSSKCLDIDAASLKPMASVFQWLCGDGPNQQFLIANRGSLARLQVRHSGMCLDVQNAGRAPGTPIIQWPCSTGHNQEFWIMPSERPTALHSTPPRR
jgi:hypothetical protein